jgi:hypothetical protein
MKAYLGFDRTQPDGYTVAARSLVKTSRHDVPVYSLRLSALRVRELYTRPTEERDGQLWDCISDAPMSTEFAISRFLVPTLAKEGWALFADSDVLFRANVLDMPRDQRYAVMCVKHQHNPANTEKMDGKQQTQYARKNWSSVMLFNCDHPANKALTVEAVNTKPGRDLHRFYWLDDDEIGELPPEWNWLVGHSQPCEPKAVHFTDGTPDMAGYETAPYADEWRSYLAND